MHGALSKKTLSKKTNEAPSPAFAFRLRRGEQKNTFRSTLALILCSGVMGMGENPVKSKTNENSPASKAAGPVSYSSYLKVPELTALQQPLSSPVAHDELLFIIVHQTYELWFKQVLFEMETLVAMLLEDELTKAFRLMGRIKEIFQVLVQQVNVIETMTPMEFNQFRSHLNPASGFQSYQFRELEILSGADPAQYAVLMELKPEWKAALQTRLRNVSLRTAFIQLLAKREILPSRDPQDLPKAILTIYQEEKHEDLASLCECLIHYDEQFSLWRFRHVQMVERMIGMKKGTGGSLGVKYLQETLKTRFFPELWEARTEMSPGSY